MTAITRIQKPTPAEMQALRIRSSAGRPLFQKMPFADAWRETNGKLPSVHAFRQYFLGSGLWRSAAVSGGGWWQTTVMPEGGWWTGDIVVAHPVKGLGSFFDSRHDVYDPVSKMRIPASEMRNIQDALRETIFGIGVLAVVVRPGEVATEGGDTIIRAKEAHVIHYFIRTGGGFAKIDETTGIPGVEITDEEWKKLDFTQRGWFFRTLGTDPFVRPAVYGVKYRNKADGNKDIDPDFCRFVGPRHWVPEGFWTSEIAIVKETGPGGVEEGRILLC